MGSTEIGQHTDGRLDDVCQSAHLVGLTDASLKESHLCLFVEQPHAEGYANLRVVALGRAYHVHRGCQQLVQPLLDHRLTVGASNTYNGNVELVAMALCQSLQGCQWRRDNQEVGIIQRGKREPTPFPFPRDGRLSILLDDEVADASAIEVFDISVTVVTGGLQGKKQCSLRETQRAAVGQQPANLGIDGSDAARTYQGGNLLNAIVHDIEVSKLFCKSRIFFP